MRRRGEDSAHRRAHRATVAGPGVGARRLRVAVALLLTAATLRLGTYDEATPPARALTAAGPVALPAVVPEPSTTTATTTALEPVTVPAAPSTTPPAPATTAASPPLPPTSAPEPVRAPPPPPAPLPVAATVLDPPGVPSGLAPYRGLGTWVDVYDWTNSYTGGRPTASPPDVDRMAELGVQTLYIQASKHDAPTDLVEPELLQAFIDRANGKGMRVVVWYLPTLVDPGRDLQRMQAMAALRGVDSLAVDIEARNVSDVNERNRRLIELSSALRRALPGRTIGAIVLPAVVMEVVNPAYWPAFPYRELAPSYDVWMPMDYWTNRTSASGYRDAYRYTRENVDRLRANLGQPQAPVHPIGGIANGVGVDDVEAFKRAAADTASIGGSLYDWRTTAEGLWPALRGFRTG